MWRGVVLLLLCLLTFTAGLGRAAITDFDEAFYAEAGREMVASGDWVTPHYNFEPRLQKPILFYWLVASTYAVAGVSEVAARVWAALSGVGLAFVAYGVGSRWIGRGPGLLAGLIVATSFGFVPFARQSLPDVPLALFISIGIWALIEVVHWPIARADRPAVAGRWSRPTWLYVAAVAMGLGTLTKGPVALALPAMAVLPLAWRAWRSGVRVPGTHPGDPASPPLGGPHLVIAAGLFILVAAPWYVAETRALGADYLRQFFIGENLERFATTEYNAWRGWSYPPALAGMLLPWSAFGLLWLRPLTRRLSGAIPMSAVDVRLMSWVLGPLALLMISVGSQPRYAVPCLVPLAILLGRTIWSHAVGSADARPSRLVMVSGVAAGAVTIGIAALLFRASALLTAANPAWSPSGLVLMTAFGMLTVVMAVAAPRKFLPLVMTATATVSLLVFQWSILSPGRPEPVEVIAGAARAANPGTKICACGVFGRSLNFYTHLETVRGDDDEGVREFLESPDRRLAAVDAHRLARAERALGRTFPRLAEVSYVNTNIWLNPPTLLDPDPSAFLQRVILVSTR